MQTERKGEAPRDPDLEQGPHPPRPCFGPPQRTHHEDPSWLWQREGKRPRWETCPELSQKPPHRATQWPPYAIQGTGEGEERCVRATAQTETSSPVRNSCPLLRATPAGLRCEDRGSRQKRGGAGSLRRVLREAQGQGKEKGCEASGTTATTKGTHSPAPYPTPKAPVLPPNTSCPASKRKLQGTVKGKKETVQSHFKKCIRIRYNYGTDFGSIRKGI